MKVITIQHESVLEQLMNEGIYFNDLLDVSENLKEPYKFMAQEYGYKHRPLFACPVGFKCNFYGAKAEDSVGIILDVPEEFLRFQNYYNWSDLIYFMEIPNEFEQLNTLYTTLWEYGHCVLTEYSIDSLNKNMVTQATLDEFRKEWVIETFSVTEEFLDRYSGTGGAFTLEEPNRVIKECHYFE